MNPGIRNSVEEPLLKGNFNTPEELHEKKVMAEGEKSFKEKNNRGTSNVSSLKNKI